MEQNARPTLRRMFAGPTVTMPAELTAYIGRKAAERIVGGRRREAYLYNYDQLGLNYSENVEYQLRREQIILCPHTADALYGEFAPLAIRYQPGSRPELERVVRKETVGCETDTEKALALMRFCRDLYRAGDWHERSMDKYVYGGTEEQLIEKGEQLCECLGRLHAALCEIARIPGRIVMHDIGGHVTSEVYVDGGWAYIDPRCGVYFRKPDGSLASVWELWNNPGLIWAQDERVKTDVSPRWSWEYRAWKCESRYFNPREVNGFENYSLADAERYNYEQLPYQEAVDRGLFRINVKYRDAIADVFNHDPAVLDGWDFGNLRTLSISFRNDGFSMFSREAELDRQYLEEHFIDPHAGTGVEIVEWGLGPGSVFCFDTKVGEKFGEPLSDKQWQIMRKGDRRVYEHVTALIEAGTDPLKVAVERSHELDLQIFARLEMQHEYGPADPENWEWVGFVGSFNKNHPGCRIPGGVQLDFKHPEVRDFKLAVLREAAEAGVDGLSLDFAVYPPYFEAPDAEIMTQFMRDCWQMLDEVGQAQGRDIQIMARIPHQDPESLGLDWKQWVREGLIDYLVPTASLKGFDIPIERYVAFSRKHGCKVFACLWHSMGLVTTDPQPGDEEAGIRRYERPKTQEVFSAQAMLAQRMQADGLQVAMPSGDEMLSRPWLATLGQLSEIQHASKQYIVEPAFALPAPFELPDEPPYEAELTTDLRMGDNPSRAIAEGHAVNTTLHVYCRRLGDNERLQVYVNGRGSVEVTDPSEAPVDWHQGDRSFINEPDWWKRGQHRVSTDPQWWRMGNNQLRLVYSVKSLQDLPKLNLTWLELHLSYDSSK